MKGNLCLASRVALSAAKKHLLSIEAQVYIYFFSIPYHTHLTHRFTADCLSKLFHVKILVPWPLASVLTIAIFAINISTALFI